METAKEEKPLWKQPTGFAATHCRHCHSGWTRMGQEGGILTVCLLDNTRALENMTDCDRYEPRSKV